MTYSNFLRWLRNCHGWLGLWGALLGLTFGTGGIWLNHRAVLKLPPAAQERSHQKLELPEGLNLDDDPQAMETWIGQQLNIKKPASSTRIEPERPAPWSEDKKIQQPEHWTFTYGGPNKLIQADYWQGNHSVKVTTTENGFVATLTNLHKGIGMPIAWVLLVDTLAGSLILLSLTGVLLWIALNRRRAIGAGIFLISTALVIGVAAWSWQG